MEATRHVRWAYRTLGRLPVRELRPDVQLALTRCFSGYTVELRRVLHFEQVLGLSFDVILDLELLKIEHHPFKHVDRRILGLSGVFFGHLVYFLEIVDDTGIPSFLQDASLLEKIVRRGTTSHDSCSCLDLGLALEVGRILIVLRGVVEIRLGIASACMVMMALVKRVEHHTAAVFRHDVVPWVGRSAAVSFETSIAKLNM